MNSEVKKNDKTLFDKTLPGAYSNKIIRFGMKNG